MQKEFAIRTHFGRLILSLSPSNYELLVLTMELIKPPKFLSGGLNSHCRPVYWLARGMGREGGREGDKKGGRRERER